MEDKTTSSNERTFAFNVPVTDRATAGLHLLEGIAVVVFDHETVKSMLAFHLPVAAFDGKNSLADSSSHTTLVSATSHSRSPPALGK